MRDAIRFVEDHGEELLALGRQAAIEGMVLDFGCFTSGEAAARFYFFPSQLLQAAGALGIDVELSLCAVGGPS